MSGGVRGARVVYQAKPSLRLQPPGATGIRFHCDADYMHQVTPKATALVILKRGLLWKSR
jgi:hypothetical protein